jgi:hypothetical protein
MTTIRDGNGAASTGMRSRQVCDHCGGPFGMVTHRWWGSKFCKRRCKDAYLREIMLDRTTVQRWCGLLGVISRSRSLPDQKGSCVAPVYYWPSTAVPSHSMSRCPGTAAGLAKALRASNCLLALNRMAALRR